MKNRVFILGGGPSLSKLNLSLIRDEHIIGCNAAFLDYPFVDELIFGDCRFAERYFPDEVLAFKGKKITGCPQLKNNPEFIYYKKDETTCLTWHPKKLAWPNGKGPNTGGMAINYAVHLGYKQIILLGYDGQKKFNRHNFHDHYRDKHNPGLHIYLKFHKMFEGIARELKGTNIEVINANPGSALECFPKVKFSEIV